MKRYLPIMIATALILVGQTTNPLKDFFEKRLSQGGKSTLQEHVGAAERAEKYDQMALKDALPAILAALRSNDPQVSVDAALVLTSIARRPDSGLLLKPWHQDILALLNRTDTRFGGAAIMIFEGEMPPPKDVLPILAQFVMNDSQPNDLKPGIVHGLIRIDSSSPETLGAINHLMLRPIDRSTRIATLNAIGGSRVEDLTLIGLVSRNLVDPDPYIRAAAIQTVSRMGTVAVAKTTGQLGRIANDPAETKELRDRAQAALNHTQYIPPRPPGFQEYHAP
jgi:hypothetical protein